MRNNYSKIISGCMVALGLLVASSTSHAQYVKPKQVIVSAKIIEFQATKGVETGLSAYYKQIDRLDPFGNVIPNGNAINSADLTFPSSTAAGLSVFLDRISLHEGDFEIVLQALADENKATILFRPRAMVPMNPALVTTIKTTEKIPYESTKVVGATTIQVVEFKDTGVTLNFTALDAIDDDGDPKTKHDTFIKLRIDATVREEGQRIIVALDDQLAAAGNFSLAQNAITAPEFVSRQIITTVWVPEGQVLMLGGLYRNSENKTLSTLPWIQQGESIATGFIDRIIPGNSVSAPLSSTIGNRNELEARRELVFLIKVESWSESFSLGSDLGFDDTDLFNIDVESDINSEELVTDIPEDDKVDDAPKGDTP
jgi:hypothetical protein